MNVCMVSLGCSKNVVDAEVMAGLLVGAEHRMVENIADADAIIVNTCGFIQSAKEEAIEAIFTAVNERKDGAKLVVTGCLAQRYPDEILAEIPEVDAVLGVGEIGDIVANLERMTAGQRLRGADKPFTFYGDAPRILSTPGHLGYLKIADGCDNICAYCAIPGIRGRYVSRPMDALIREGETLLSGGAREIVLVAQDTTRYGLDIYGEPRLLELLRGLSAAANRETWLRVLYCYPEMIDECLLDAMLETSGVCRYLDVPIQHVSEDVLSAMNRRGGRKAIERMYRLARDRGFTLRTTVMVGFPGETNAQFEELTSFLGDHPFDRLGAFAYSMEEGTSAAAMKEQIPQRIKQARERTVMRIQQDISRALLQKRVGTTCRVLVERLEDGCAFARSAAEAPEIDGEIVLPPENLSTGSFVNVEIVGATDHDLEGVIA